MFKAADGERVLREMVASHRRAGENKGGSSPPARGSTPAKVVFLDEFYFFFTKDGQPCVNGISYHCSVVIQF